MKKLNNTILFRFITLSCLLIISVKGVSQSTILAEQYAFEAAKKLTSEYCYWSGDNTTAYVQKAEYDYSSNKYIIKMTASWYGKPCTFCDYGTFQIEGVLQVHKDGTDGVFNPTVKNSFVKKSEFYSNSTKAVIVLGLVSAAASSKD
jgi:hypothetical protein